MPRPPPPLRSPAHARCRLRSGVGQRTSLDLMLVRGSSTMMSANAPSAGWHAIDLLEAHCRQRRHPANRLLHRQPSPSGRIPPSEEIIVQARAHPFYGNRRRRRPLRRGPHSPHRDDGQSADQPREDRGDSVVSRSQNREGWRCTYRDRANELTGLKHLDGTISMARGGPNTATSDVLICIGDRPELDFAGKRNADGQGFAAFGKVTSGKGHRATHSGVTRERSDARSAGANRQHHTNATGV